MSLYRKYRPQNFQNLVGQDHVRTTLLHAILEGRLTHAYLFSGPRGTGKTSTARLVAKALNCVARSEEGEPCEGCEFCKDLVEGRLIDLIEIDAASNRGIDEMRDLKEKINFAPTRAKNKVYIIDEVHMLTKEAFNALLKTLEEPPENVYFILATTEVHKVPETILSRCQRFDFKRIDLKTLMTRLSYIAQLEGIVAEDRAIEAIARNAEGGLRDAIGLLEQLTVEGKLTYSHAKEVLGISDSMATEKLFEHLTHNAAQSALAIVHELYNEGSDLTQFTKDFLEYLRQKMHQAVLQKQEDDVGRLLMIVDIFQKALDELRISEIPQLPLELAILQLCYPQTNEKTEKTIEEKVIEKPIEKPVEKSADDNVGRGTVPIPEETVSAESETPPPVLSLDQLRINWPRVFEHMKSPTLRRSLKDAAPIEMNGVNLMLQFNTQFHMEQVMEPIARIELEKVIEHLFQKQVKISGRVKPIAIQPVVEEDPLTQKTLEIFGGEIVE